MNTKYVVAGEARDDKIQSEHQFHRKLDDSIVTGLQAAVAADIACDLAEVRRIERNGAADTAWAAGSRSG